MAFAKKYHNGVPSEDTSTYSAEIWEDGFVGSSTYMNLELIDGLVGDWGKKGDPISASNWHRALRSELRLANEKAVIEDLLGGTDEQFQIRCYVSGSIWWSTYLMPDTLRKAEHHDHSALIQGHDGIELLKRKIWAVTPGIDTPLQGIADILALLDLGGLAIKTANDIYPVSSLTSSDDPIDNVDIDWDHVKEEIAELNNRFVSAYSIFEHILKRYRLRITQAEGGFWLLEQRHTKFNSTQNIFQYTSAGAQDTPHQSTITALAYDETNVRQSERGELGLRKSYNSIRITYEHGTIRETILTNPKFTFNPALGAGSRYTGWTDNFTSGGFGGYPSGNTPGSMGNPAKSAAGMPIVKFSWPSEDPDLIDSIASVSVPYITQVTAERVGGGTDDKLVVQLQFLARGFATLEAAVADSFYAFWSLKYDGNWLNKDTWSFDDATLGDDNKIPLQFQLDTLAGVNEEFDISSSNGFVELRLHGPIDFQTPTGEANPTFIEKASWAPVVLDFLEGAADNNVRKSTIVYSPSVDLDSLDDKLEDQSFFIGDGPTSVHDGRIRLSSDGSKTTEWKLSNGTADGSELGLDRLWGKLDLRQQLIPVDTMYQRFPIGSTPWTIQRHLTYDGFNWDAVYFRKDYRSAVVLAEVVKLRFDSVNEGAVVEEDPDLDGTYYPPTGELPTRRDPLPRPDGLDCSPYGWGYLKWALMAFVQQSSGASVIYNHNRLLSSPPDGTIVGDELTYEDELGLVSTDTDDSDYGTLPATILGGDTLTRFFWSGEWRRDASGNTTLFKATAGTAGVYEVILLSTGKLRIAATDNAATATENVDSNLVVLQNERFTWGVAVETAIASGVVSKVFLYIQTESGAAERIPYTHTYDLSGDITSYLVLEENAQAARILWGVGDAPTPTLQQFISHANCLRRYSAYKGVETTGGNHDTLVLLGASKLFSTDEQLTVDDEWTHSLTVDTYVSRPVWVPTIAKYTLGNGTKTYAGPEGGGFTETHDWTGTKKTQALAWDHFLQRLYYGTSNDAGNGDGEIGYWSGIDTGSWTPSALSGTSGAYVRDMAVSGFVNRIWTLEGDGDIHERTLTGAEISTISQVGASIVAIDFSDSLNYLFWMESDGSVYAIPIIGSGVLTYTPSVPAIQIVDGTSLTSGGGKGLAAHNLHDRIYELLDVSSEDHVVRFYGSQSGQTSGDDLDDLGEQIHSLSLTSKGITELAAPVLSAGTPTATTIPVSWTDITGETEYVLQWSTDSFATILGSATYGADVVAGEGSLLTPETTYQLRVRGGTGSKPGPWSNTVEATTAAQSLVMLAAVHKTVGGYSRIYFIDVGGGGATGYITITGNWPTTSGDKLIAYHPTIDRILYINAGGSLRSIKRDGTSDTLAYSIGGTDNFHSMWVDTDGNVIIERGTTSTANGYIKFSYVDDITGNVDSTWNAPTTGGSAGDFRDDSQDSNSGGDRVGLRAAGIWTLLPPAGFTLVTGTSDANGTCFYDYLNSRIHFHTDSGAIKRVPEGGGTVTTVVASAGSPPTVSNIWVQGDYLYWVKDTVASAIRRADADDGSGEIEWYAHFESLNVDIKSIHVADFTGL